MKNLYMQVGNLCHTWLAPVANLWARIFVGMVFFKSGLAKIDDMESTIEEFEPGESFAVPGLSDLSPELAAYMATVGELVLPVLLIAGLLTRFGAAGLFVMAAVIQFFVYPEPQHVLWMICCAMLVGYGGNKLSVDNFLFKGAK